MYNHFKAAFNFFRENGSAQEYDANHPRVAREKKQQQHKTRKGHVKKITRQAANIYGNRTS